MSVTSCDSVENDNLLDVPVVDPNEDSYVGLGTLETPFTVDEILRKYAQNDNATGVWAKGYIVGYRLSNDTDGVVAGDYLGEQPSYLSDLNLYIAMTPDETDYKNCVSIQVTYNYRSILGLQSNPANLGKEIMIKGDIERYNSIAGLKNMSNYRIDGDGPEETPDVDADFTGTGELETPYTVADVINKKPNSTSDAVESNIWAKGFIVGYRLSTETNGIAAGDYFGTQASYESDVNIYIADTKDETNYQNCISIQVTSDFRTVIGLQSNPANMGKEVMIKGDIMKYNSIAGIKNMTNYRLDGEGPEDKPEEKPETGDVEVSGDASTAVTYLSYDFSDVTNNVDFSKDGWQNLFTAGSRKWQGKYFSTDKNYYVQATAYGATAGETQESWLITPGLNLDLAEEKTFSFKSAVAYWNETTTFEVYVLQNVDGTTVRTKLDGLTLPTSSTTNYLFVESGNIDLSSYSGVVYIGFMYNGVGGASGTSASWCVDDVQFGKVVAAETSISFKYDGNTVYVNEELDCNIFSTVANGQGITEFTVDGIPAWATFVDHGDGSASIYGIAPETAETTTVIVTATNNGVSSDVTFNLEVKEKVAVDPNQALVVNGDFSNGTEGWTFKYATASDEGTLYTVSTEDGLTITQGATQAAGRVDILQDITVEEGASYKVTFKYKSSHEKLRIWSYGVDSDNTFIFHTSANTTDPFRSYNKYFPAVENWSSWEKEEELVFKAEGFTTYRLEFRGYRQADSFMSLKDIVVEKID